MDQKQENPPAPEASNLLNSLVAAAQPVPTILKLWQIIRTVVFVVALIGWLVVLVLTIKNALADKVLHETEVENIKNIAKVMLKLTGMEMPPTTCFSGLGCDTPIVSEEIKNTTGSEIEKPINRGQQSG